jgi:hypothetical protein
MKKTLRVVALLFTAAAVISLTAGCGSGIATENSTLSSNSTQGQRGGRQQFDNSGRTAVLTRAAQILGITSDKFITAYQNATTAVMGNFNHGWTGTPPSGMPFGGQFGQPPAPPSGSPPSGAPQFGQRGGQRPPDGQFQPPTGVPQFITDIYNKMAIELGISAEVIASAMTQAENELRNTR